MSKRELIEAFIRGDVDRRQFVSRLTMLGVSGGAAVAYASSLGKSAMAAPAQPAAGYVMRAQATDDADYGTAVVIETVEEAVTTAINSVQGSIATVFDSLGQFTPDDFEEGVYETLGTIQTQVQEQLDALSGALGAAAAPRVTRLGFQGQQISTPEEFLEALSQGFDDTTAMFAAVVPATPGSGEERQTLFEIASINSRHAALVHDSTAGWDPLPGAFEQPELPEI